MEYTTIGDIQAVRQAETENRIRNMSDQSTAVIDDGWEWAAVEIFGFRKHAGRCREVERFGAKMLRVDIPTDGYPSNGWTTHFYSGSSIFSYTLTTMEAVLKANKPVLSAYLAPSVPRSFQDQHYDDDDEPLTDEEVMTAAAATFTQTQTPSDPDIPF